MKLKDNAEVQRLIGDRVILENLRGHLAMINPNARNAVFEAGYFADSFTTKFAIQPLKTDPTISQRVAVGMATVGRELLDMELKTIDAALRGLGVEL